MFPGGLLGQRYGGKIVILSSIILCAVLTALTPIVASFVFWMSCALRFFIGLAGVETVMLINDSSKLNIHFC